VHWRKWFFRLHGWLGLNAGLLLFVVCLSGTFATLSEEIDGLVDPRHRISAPPTEDAEFDWTGMLRTLERAFPDGQARTVSVPGASALPAEGGRAAALAFVALPNGETRKAYLDPYTGELRGHTSFFNTARFFRTFHRRFFDGSRGILIVTLTGFLLLASGITGFGFYKGWVKQLFAVQLRSSRRRRWSELHKVAGIWVLPFAIVIAVTGVYYFVEVTYDGLDAYDPPPMRQVDEGGLAAFGPRPELLPAGAYVEAAEEAYPELDVRTLRISHAPGQAVYVAGRAGNPLTRDRADKVHLHPFTGAVIGIQRTSDLGVVPFMTDAVDPLHFGYFGGFGTQVLWFVLGLLLSFSILSGTYIWVVRSTTGRKEPLALLRGAPVSVALTLLYLAFVGFATVDGIRGYAASNGDPVTVGGVRVGPYDVRVDCALPCDLQAGARLAARFLGPGLPNYERAEVLSPDGLPARLVGPSWRPRASLDVANGEAVTMRVVTRDGAVHTASFVPSVPDQSVTTLAEWPDTASGVWWVVIGFSLLTVGSILAWLGMVWHVARDRGPAASAPA
jgi:uncharacterized iron-regulated membrane protein